jgi:hypothetical protein
MTPSVAKLTFVLLAIEYSSMRDVSGVYLFGTMPAISAKTPSY